MAPAPAALADPMPAPKAPPEPAYQYGPKNCACPGPGKDGFCGYYESCCHTYMKNKKQVGAQVETYRDSPGKAWCPGCCGWGNYRKRKPDENPRWKGEIPKDYVPPKAKLKTPPPAPGQWPGVCKMPPPAVPKPKAKPKAKQAQEKAAAKAKQPAAGELAEQLQAAVDGLAHVTQNAHEATVAVGDFLGAFAQAAAAAKGAAPKEAPKAPVDDPKAAPEAAEAPAQAPAQAPAPAGPHPVLGPNLTPPSDAAGTVQLSNFSERLRTLLGEANPGRPGADIIKAPAVQAMNGTLQHVRGIPGHEIQGYHHAALNLGLALLRPGQDVDSLDVVPVNSHGELLQLLFIAVALQLISKVRGGKSLVLLAVQNLDVFWLEARSPLHASSGPGADTVFKMWCRREGTLATIHPEKKRPNIVPPPALRTVEQANRTARSGK